MSGFGDFDLSSYSLDDVNDFFADMADNFKVEAEEKSVMTPVIEFDENAFIWEDKKLSEGLVMSQNSIQLSQESTESPDSAPATTTTYIPNIDILQAACEEVPVSSPSPSESTTSDDGESRYNQPPLMAVYGLDDDTLSDMSLKKLRALCKSDEDHFNQLKAYRRTCLNRHYARSSRAKNLRQTKCMSSELEKSKHTIAKLTKENQEKDDVIKYLQLELQILRTMKK